MGARELALRKIRLNRPRMFPLGHRCEGVVEAHRDVADEQTAGVGHLQASQGAFHQAVGFQRRERGKFAAKCSAKLMPSFCDIAV